jgi:chaperonin GroEL
MKKKILVGNEARAALMAGINFVGDTLGRTLGPNGKNAIYGDRFRTPTITNDGVSIAKQIELTDDAQNLGAKTMIEVCQKTNDRAGDGTTTSAVIAQKLANTVNDLITDNGLVITKKPNVLEIRTKIEKEREQVEELLNKSARPLKKGELATIGRVSMENEELGKLVADVVEKVGADGSVNVEEAEQKDITVEYKEGIEIPLGLYTPLMANKKDGTFKQDNPKIIVTSHKLTAIAQVQKIAQEVANTTPESALIIVAPEFDPSIIAACVANKIHQGFVILPVRYYESYQMELAEDIAAKTGATFIRRETDRLEDVLLSSLGTCDSLSVVDDRTTFIGAKADVSEQIKKIKAVKPKSEYDKVQQEERIASLKGMVATIKVGAKTHQERTYLKLKIDDAVCACKMAARSGVVRGGGLALYNIADQFEILKDALKAPHEKIKENGTKTIPEWVYDPVDSVKVGLENACSVASLVLTTDILIAEVEDEKE